MSVINSLDDLGKTVSKYAPLLGAVLPFPGAAALGTLISETFGGDVNKPQELISRIMQDPEASIKLATIQSNERIEIERLAVESMKAQNEDLANARSREIEISKIPESQRDKEPFIIAIMFLIGYFALATLIVVAIVTNQVSTAELQPIIQMLKDMGLATMIILTFYFGSAYKQSKQTTS
jgi:hypothetical protein